MTWCISRVNVRHACGEEVLHCMGRTYTTYWDIHVSTYGQEVLSTVSDRTVIGNHGLTLQLNSVS